MSAETTTTGPVLRAFGRVLRDLRIDLEKRIERVAAKAITNAELVEMPDSDGRKYRLLLLRGDDSVIEREVIVAVPAHKGRWDAQRRYHASDEVAWKGCSWRARSATHAEEPGRSNDWLLVAKQGERGAPDYRRLEALEAEVRELREMVRGAQPPR